MDVLLESLNEEWARLLRLLPRLLMALLVLVIAFVASRMVSGAWGRLLQRAKLSGTHRHFFRHLVSVLIVALGVIVALHVVGLRGLANSLLASGGVTAVILGFAFREIGENFLAGFFLAFSRPFQVGDLIESEGLLGRVRSVELRHTHIRTADARDIYIPNAQIFNRPVVNYTRDGLRRPTVSIGIDYGDDLRQARGLLIQAVRGTPGVLSKHDPLVVVHELGPAYVVLHVSFWMDTFQEGISLPQVQSAVLENCRDVLRDAGFTFSTDVVTNLALQSRQPLDVHLESES